MTKIEKYALAALAVLVPLAVMSLMRTCRILSEAFPNLGE